MSIRVSALNIVPWNLACCLSLCCDYFLVDVLCCLPPLPLNTPWSFPGWGIWQRCWFWLTRRQAASIITLPYFTFGFICIFVCTLSLTRKQKVYMQTILVNPSVMALDKGKPLFIENQSLVFRAPFTGEEWSIRENCKTLIRAILTTTSNTYLMTQFLLERYQCFYSEHTYGC